jgi:hypothetical protein
LAFGDDDSIISSLYEEYVSGKTGNILLTPAYPEWSAYSLWWNNFSAYTLYMPMLKYFSFFSLKTYSMTSLMTPAPTVRPPSRIANRNSFSIAIGVINSTVKLTLSPGITISTPSGNTATPVTSVVRK